MWASSKALTRIFSQDAGSACTFWVNPVEFTSGLGVGAQAITLGLFRAPGVIAQGEGGWKTRVNCQAAGGPTEPAPARCRAQGARGAAISH